jgi:RNA polymerase sigma factor (sigma-70 family)
MRALARNQNSVDTDCRASYMRGLASEPLLDREQEQRWAIDLRESREEACARFLELPPDALDRIADHDEKGPELGRHWPLDRLDRWFDRLEAYVSTANDRPAADVLGALRRIKRRIDRARDVLVRSNLRLVPHVVKQLSHSGSPLLDLIQEGNLGLLRAVDRFDPSRGFRFSTYAYWWIRRGLSGAFADGTRLIRLPANVLAQHRALHAAYAELESRLGRPPRTHELAERANLSIERVRALQELSPDPVSLEGSDTDSDGPGVLGRLADDSVATPLEALIDRETRKKVLRALEVLTPRERRIVRLRYGIRHSRAYSLREVGAKVRLSRERVRQIEAEALSRIQAWTAEAN